jgi:hypothetical protein
MNMLFILKGQDLTPIFRAHACARSALRMRQSRWRPQHSSPRAALGAVISMSTAPVGAYAPHWAASGWAVGF